MSKSWIFPTAAADNFLDFLTAILLEAAATNRMRSVNYKECEFRREIHSFFNRRKLCLFFDSE